MRRGGTFVRLAACAAALAAFAFLYNQFCAFRAELNPLDTGGAFDGAYRVCLGQWPLRDFYTHVGLGLCLYTGLFLRWFGVSYASFAAAASALDAAAVLLAFACCWKLTRDVRLTSASALVTALWFTPVQHATPWYDYSAFLLLLAALTILLVFEEALPACAAAGALAAAAIYEKQPSGGLGAAFLALYLWQSGSLKRAAAFAVGAAAGFAAWTALWSCIGSFDALTRYMFLLPLTWHKAGGHSLVPFGLAAAFALAALGLLPRDQRPLGVPAAALAGWALTGSFAELYLLLPLAALPFLAERRERALLAALTLIQYASHLFSKETPYQFWFFIGIQLALAARALPAKLRWAAYGFAALMAVRLGVVRRVHPGWMTVPLMGPAAAAGLFVAAGLLFRRRQRLAAAACLALACGAAGQAVKAYRSRRGVGTWPEPAYALRLPLLEGLHNLPDTGEPLDQAYDYLKALPPSRRPVFLSSYAMLYGALGQAPPQPFQWLSPGLTLRPGEPDDSRFCGSLARNGVRTAMIYGAQDGSLPEDLFGGLPCLNDWLRSGFVLDRRIGRFLFYKPRARA